MVILRLKSPNRSCRFWDPSRKTLHHRFWGQIGRKPRHRFWGQTGRNHPSDFEVKSLTNRPRGFETKSLINRRHWFGDLTKSPPSVLRSNQKNRHHWCWGQTGENHLNVFEAKLLTNHRTWFWGWTEKFTLLISMCMMYIAYGVTRPPDCLTTEYPTCATISCPLHQVSYSYHDRYRCLSRAHLSPAHHETSKRDFSHEQR
jgi:hypothetical protein